MKKLVIQLIVVLMRFINLFFKPLKLQKRAVIISRQANEPTLDIELLSKSLKKHGIETTILCKKIEKNFIGLFSYGLHIIKQIYYLSISEIVVLDGYCIVVSVLPKKANQKVIQMWHALGAIKKFGWQNVESPDGHSRVVAETMKMHRNYDYLMAPGHLTGEIFSEAFRVEKDKIIYLGLPRIDYLKNSDKETAEQINNKYPGIREKTNILYAPTFRKNASVELEKIIDGFNFESSNLIVKKHFLDKDDYLWAKKLGAIVDESFSSMDWLKVVDKVISDYSAIIFEAAILNKDIYIYQPDIAAYANNVGLNIYLENEAISKYVFSDAKKLQKSLEESYDKKRVEEFLNKYIEVNLDNCTEQLSDFIVSLMKK